MAAGSCGTVWEYFLTGVFLRGVDGLHGRWWGHGNDSAELGRK